MPTFLNYFNIIHMNKLDKDNIISNLHGIINTLNSPTFHTLPNNDMGNYICYFVSGYYENNNWVTEKTIYIIDDIFRRFTGKSYTYKWNPDVCIWETIILTDDILQKLPLDCNIRKHELSLLKYNKLNSL